MKIRSSSGCAAKVSEPAVHVACARAAGAGTTEEVRASAATETAAVTAVQRGRGGSGMPSSGIEATPQQRDVLILSPDPLRGE